MIYENTPWEARLVLIDTSLREGTFSELVRGLGQFECHVTGWSRHDAYTAMYNIDRYVKERGNAQLWRSFEDELIAMCDDAQYCWLAVSYVRALLMKLRQSREPSPIGFAILQSRLSEMLPRFENELRGMETLGPSYCEGQGMWGFVMYLLKAIGEDGYDFDVGVLPPAPPKREVSPVPPPSLADRIARWLEKR